MFEATLSLVSRKVIFCLTQDGFLISWESVYWWSLLKYLLTSKTQTENPMQVESWQMITKVLLMQIVSWKWAKSNNSFISVLANRITLMSFMWAMPCQMLKPQVPFQHFMQRRTGLKHSSLNQSDWISFTNFVVKFSIIVFLDSPIYLSLTFFRVNLIRISAI